MDASSGKKECKRNQYPRGGQCPPLALRAGVGNPHEVREWMPRIELLSVPLVAAAGLWGS